jgi:cytochrome c biogenesis protein CcdA
MNSIFSFLPIVAAAAIIDSVNLCAFSVLLLTIAFLFSAGNLRSGILKIGGSYIAGIFLVYVLIGLGIMRALYLFNVPNFTAKIGAVILIILGVINIINEFFPKFPMKLKIPNSAHDRMGKLIAKGSAPAAFLLGAFVGLSEFPCIGGPYLTILGFLHDRSAYVKGFAYLLVYNLIFILPLLIVLFIASNKVLLAKIQTWQSSKTIRIRFLSGIAMIILGIIIFML